MRELPAGRFEAQCLALLDEVARSGEQLVVTRRGRPVARVVPVEEPPPLAGSVEFLVEDEELLFSTGQAWRTGGP